MFPACVQAPNTDAAVGGVAPTRPAHYPALVTPFDTADAPPPSGNIHFHTLNTTHAHPADGRAGRRGGGGGSPSGPGMSASFAAAPADPSALAARALEAAEQAAEEEEEEKDC